MTVINYLLLAVILIGSFAVKVPVLNFPFLGHFGSYQAMSAMMARMITWDSFYSVLVPRSMVIVEGGPALHLLYYPFSSLVASLLNRLTGLGIDFCGRFQSALFIFLSAWVLYVIVKKIYDQKTALISCFLFSFSPMVLISGISFQNEAVALFFLLTSFLLVLNGGAKSALIGGLLFSFAVIARIHFAVFIPVFLITFWQKKTLIKHGSLFIFLFAAAVTGWVAYFYYLDKTSSNIWTSIFRQSGEGRFFIYPLLKTREFYLRMAKIIAVDFLTPVSFLFLIFGFFNKNRRCFIFQIWFVLSLSTIFVLPQKVYEHPFYLIAGIPAASVLCALVVARLLDARPKFLMPLFIVAFCLLSFRLYAAPAWSAYREDKYEIAKIGQSVQQLARPEERIVAAYGASAALLYYCDRFGWGFDLNMNEQKIDPLEEAKFPHKEWYWQARENGYGDPVRWLEHLRKQGAKYFVIAEEGVFLKRESFSSYVFQHYAAVPAADSSFLMFDLTQEP